MNKRLLSATASAVAVGCLLAGVPVASAQSSSSSLSSVGGHDGSTALGQSSESFLNLLNTDSSDLSSESIGNTDLAYRLGAFLANSPSANGGTIEAVLSSMNAFGSSEPFVDRPETPALGYPKPVDETITEPRLVRKVDENRTRLQRWYIESPSMKRVVEVQVMLPADSSVPSPMLYLLDGIAAERNSGWVTSQMPAFFEDKNVTIVMPTEAPSSLYTDWQKPDPFLGVMKWETFLSKELPSVMESEAAGLAFNGKRGIGGLSMGAMGAVRNAALHPDVWDAVMGISGCYSTTDSLGRNITEIVLANRGGDSENMWGPYGSEDWMRNDITANPEGLRNMAVFLASADGFIDEDYIDIYKKRGSLKAMITGAVLEQGTNRCTMRLDEAMKDSGMNHQKVVYQQGGAHRWEFFNQMIEPGWDHIKDALGR